MSSDSFFCFIFTTPTRSIVITFLNKFNRWCPFNGGFELINSLSIRFGVLDVLRAWIVVASSAANSGDQEESSKYECRQVFSGASYIVVHKPDVGEDNVQKTEGNDLHQHVAHLWASQLIVDWSFRQFRATFVNSYLGNEATSRLYVKDALLLTLVPSASIGDRCRSSTLFWLILFCSKSSFTMSHTILKLSMVNLLIVWIGMSTYSMHESILPLAFVSETRFKLSTSLAMRPTILVPLTFILNGLALNVSRFL